MQTHGVGESLEKASRRQTLVVCFAALHTPYSRLPIRN